VRLTIAVQGASERLVPILMIAPVTALGLLRPAIGSGAAGKKIEGPLAIVLPSSLLPHSICPCCRRWPCASDGSINAFENPVCRHQSNFRSSAAS